MKQKNEAGRKKQLIKISLKLFLIVFLLGTTGWLAKENDIGIKGIDVVYGDIGDSSGGSFGSGDESSTSSPEGGDLNGDEGDDSNISVDENGRVNISVTPGSYEGDLDSGLETGSTGSTSSGGGYEDGQGGDGSSCSASWNPKGPIAVGETSTLSWSSTGDADGWLEYVCTGPVPETGSTKVDEYPWAYETTEAGTETCSFEAKNSAGKTATCSASLVIQDSSCEVTCNNNHQPGCMESYPLSSYETDDECCDLSKKCYECSGSYSWDPINEKCVICKNDCSTESTGPGCISGKLDHANEVSGSKCCGGVKRCYQCNSGYVWDSATSKCVSTNNGRWIEVKPN